MPVDAPAHRVACWRHTLQVTALVYPAGIGGLCGAPAWAAALLFVVSFGPPVLACYHGTAHLFAFEGR